MSELAQLVIDQRREFIRLGALPIPGGRQPRSLICCGESEPATIKSKDTGGRMKLTEDNEPSSAKALAATGRNDGVKEAFVSFFRNDHPDEASTKITKETKGFRAKKNSANFVLCSKQPSPSVQNETSSPSMRFAPGKMRREMPFFRTGSWKLINSPNGIEQFRNS